MHFTHYFIVSTATDVQKIFLLLNIILKIILKFELYDDQSCYWIFMLFKSLCL